jgi:AGZA family xanthine/uracil permease-like MFS transporter
MALNAYFAYGVVLGAGHSWQVALGSVFISGLIFLALSVLPVREYIVNSIPKTLKLSIVAGIGFFLCILGFKNSGIITGNSATLVTLGDLHNPTTILSILGFFLIVGLESLGITSAIIISILSVTGISMLLGYVHFAGIFSMPPSIMPTLMQMDVRGALDIGLLTIVFAFLFVDLFDNTGTLIAIAYRAGFMDKHGKCPRLNRALIADSAAAIIGSVLGTSTTTSYLESAVGVKVGGRTGLTSIVVAVMFLGSMFLSPLAKVIPLYASAPALIYVACLMAHAFTDIDWNDPTEYAPAVITAIIMPLTFSVAEGISFGFISYTAIKIMSGRFKDLNFAVVILAIAFVCKYIFLHH